MEYNINSHTRSIQDYLVAIEYEINLDSLRRLRKKRLGRVVAHVSECRTQQDSHERQEHAGPCRVHVRANGTKVFERSERLAEVCRLLPGLRV